jgi:hypothetical protein
VTESRRSTVPHTTVNQTNIYAETAFLLSLKKVSFKTEEEKSKADCNFTWFEQHITNLFPSYNLDTKNINLCMSDEHDDISDERKDYFAKSFMQHICLTERFELMEIVT